MHAKLILEDGTEIEGQPFGGEGPAAGEVVFTTGMVGYPECLTDPSYYGQILVFTYPLIGNYGVPGNLLERLESDRVQVAGVVVGTASNFHHHAEADRSMASWLSEAGIPGLSGVDTRALTRHLRTAGTMLGKVVADGQDVDWYDPNADQLLPNVSIREPVERGEGNRCVLLVDFGCKRGIERSLLARGLRVRRVPWDHPFDEEDVDGVLLSNGPGDPRPLTGVVARARRLLARDIPVLGICLGNQIVGMAAGAGVYKLPYGHRGQNQPCIENGSPRCLVTSQNHGFAVDTKELESGWEPWFTNGNDGSCEGLRHREKPFIAVQFHPEGCPGPSDTGFVFDRFSEMIHGR